MILFPPFFLTKWERGIMLVSYVFLLLSSFKSINNEGGIYVLYGSTNRERWIKDSYQGSSHKIWCYRNVLNNNRDFSSVQWFVNFLHDLLSLHCCHFWMKWSPSSFLHRKLLWIFEGLLKYLFASAYICGSFHWYRERRKELVLRTERCMGIVPCRSKMK